MRRHCLRAFFCLAFTGGTWLSLAAAAFAEPAAQMFWTDRSTGRILRADLDGSNIQTIYQAPVFLDPYYFGVNRLAVDESQAVIYWSDTAAGTIQRMPLAGGAPQTIASGVVFPRDLEIDTAAGKLYWSAGAQVDAGGIVRANLDGSQLETLVPTILSPGIALDLQAGHLYYAQFGLGAGPNTIHRVNINGSSPQLLVPLIKDPDDVELDLVAGKMYYVNEDDGQFFRANLDGSGAEKIIDQFFEPGGHGLAVHRADGKLYWSSRALLS